MSCPSTGSESFWAGPNYLCQAKRLFPFTKFVCCASTKVFEEALNAITFLDWLKKVDRNKTFWDLQKDNALVKPIQISNVQITSLI